MSKVQYCKSSFTRYDAKSFINGAQTPIVFYKQIVVTFIIMHGSYLIDMLHFSLFNLAGHMIFFMSFLLDVFRFAPY